ncbi:MAG TPA: helix-turn-helix domain-containing protein [Polyangiaceae bacterium]|nr:helix-turn-helix domain-containing protein [Polyangiaceae bacterium]
MKSRNRRTGFRPQLGPRRASALSPLVPYHFERIGIGATLVDARGWHAVYSSRQRGHFEREHGVEDQRFRYNTSCLNRVADSKRPFIGEHHGLMDLFVPVVHLGEVREVLATGSFLRAPPTSTEIQERWREMTGRQGHLGDPEFFAYVSMWLGVRVLDAGGFDTYQRLVVVLSKLIAAEGDLEAVGAEYDALLPRITEIQSVDQMWEAAREMTDAQTELIWASGYSLAQRKEMLLSAVPEHALVGLVAGGADESDPVDEMIRRRQFQVACARMARKQTNTASGRVGDHGVVFLVPSERSDARSEARLRDLGERALTLARRTYGLRLHLGFGPVREKAPLSMRYQLALAAAERALVQGLRTAPATSSSARPEHTLRNARAELGRHLSPLGELAPRFDRYLDLVAIHAGYRIESVAVHLEAGFERLAESLVVSGALSRTVYDALWVDLARSAKEANNLRELFLSYRRAVADLEQAVREPTEAQRERNLRRAVAYIRDHVAEPLTLEHMAKLAGFAPAYFSRLFKQRERVTFARYVSDLRVERAKQLLTRTNLSTLRVAQLCGFSSSQYFHQVFRRSTKLSPLDYRRATAV